jgi:hypothetical protein
VGEELGAGASAGFSARFNVKASIFQVSPSFTKIAVPVTVIAEYVPSSWVASPVNDTRPDARTAFPFPSVRTLTLSVLLPGSTASYVSPAFSPSVSVDASLAI